VKSLFLSLVLVCMLVAVPAAAGQLILMDYSGFAWETGGVPVSNPGDVLALTAVAVQYDPLFGVSPLSQEVTIYIYDLQSTGEFLDGFGNIRISYSGGRIEVYEDTILDHDWGVSPPNGLQGTFTNGSLLLEGNFTDFFLTIPPSGAGAYEGNIDGVGGTSAAICDGLPDCAYTFGGAFSRDVGAQIPVGYDLQIDGTLEVDASVPATPTSFGAVKSLFRN
jgi:hypothetical protein